MTPRRNYKKEAEGLVKAAKKDGRHVDFNYQSREWCGMNPQAARELKRNGELKERYVPNAIRINKYSEKSNKLKSQTLRHEIVEDRLMRKRGMKYKTAHRHACHLQSSLKAVKI